MQKILIQTKTKILTTNARTNPQKPEQVVKLVMATFQNDKSINKASVCMDLSFSKLGLGFDTCSNFENTNQRIKTH